MIIDFHTHIFPGDVRRQEVFRSDPAFQGLYGSEKARLSDHGGLLSLMDREGVDRSVCMGFPWQEEEACELHNGYLLRAREETGGRLIPFGSVPRTRGAPLRRWIEGMKQQGFSGIGEMAFYDGGLDRRSALFLEEVLLIAGGQKLPICLHVNEPVGHPYPGKYEPSLGALYEIITRAPETTIILSHWGGGLPFYELMPEVKRNFGNVCYDTAASPYLYGDGIYGIAGQIISFQRILFGSDAPLLKPGRYIESIRAAFPVPEEQEAVLGGNALRLLGL